MRELFSIFMIIQFYKYSKYYLVSKYTILLEILSFQLKYMYEGLSSLRIRLSRRLKMAWPDLYGHYLAVYNKDATLRTQTGGTHADVV